METIFLPDNLELESVKVNREDRTDPIQETLENGLRVVISQGPKPLKTTAVFMVAGGVSQET